MADLVLYNECGEAVLPLPSADVTEVGPALMLTAALAMHLTNMPMSEVPAAELLQFKKYLLH